MTAQQRQVDACTHAHTRATDSARTSQRIKLQRFRGIDCHVPAGHIGADHCCRGIAGDLVKLGHAGHTNTTGACRAYHQTTGLGGRGRIHGDVIFAAHLGAAPNRADARLGVGIDDVDHRAQRGGSPACTRQCLGAQRRLGIIISFHIHRVGRGASAFDDRAGIRAEHVDQHSARCCRRTACRKAGGIQRDRLLCVGNDIHSFYCEHVGVADGGVGLGLEDIGVDRRATTHAGRKASADGNRADVHLAAGVNGHTLAGITKQTDIGCRIAGGVVRAGARSRATTTRSSVCDAVGQVMHVDVSVGDLRIGARAEHVRRTHHATGSTDDIDRYRSTDAQRPDGLVRVRLYDHAAAVLAQPQCCCLGAVSTNCIGRRADRRFGRALHHVDDHADTHAGGSTACQRTGEHVDLLPLTRTHLDAALGDHISSAIDDGRDGAAHFVHGDRAGAAYRAANTNTCSNRADAVTCTTRSVTGDFQVAHIQVQQLARNKRRRTAADIVVSHGCAHASSAAHRRATGKRVDGTLVISAHDDIRRRVVDLCIHQRRQGVGADDVAGHTARHTRRSTRCSGHRRRADQAAVIGQDGQAHGVVQRRIVYGSRGTSAHVIDAAGNANADRGTHGQCAAQGVRSAARIGTHLHRAIHTLAMAVDVVERSRSVVADDVGRVACCYGGGATQCTANGQRLGNGIGIGADRQPVGNLKRCILNRSRGGIGNGGHVDRRTDRRRPAATRYRARKGIDARVVVCIQPQLRCLCRAALDGRLGGIADFTPTHRTLHRDVACKPCGDRAGQNLGVVGRSQRDILRGQ